MGQQVSRKEENKVDYYRILGLESTATQEEIRKAYRRKAIECHPDKNILKQESAAEDFVMIQQAYSVLADDHERAAYDRERGKQGRKTNRETIDQVELVLEQYLQRSCFKDFDDTETGFYTVYRKLFDRIETAEHKEHCRKNRGDYSRRESFGTGQMKEVSQVKRFYRQWGSFQTLRSFEEYDKWDASQAQTRPEKRAMEKENKVIREKEKATYERKIRKIVQRIYKLDSRQIKQQKETSETQKPSRERLPVDNTAMHSHYGSVEIEKLEKNLKEMGLTGKEEKTSMVIFECVYCEKQFKSEGQFTTHQQSNKHKLRLKEYGVEEKSPQEIPQKPLAKKKKTAPREEDESKEEIIREEKKPLQKTRRRKKKGCENNQAFKCNVCQETFETRNKLFKHLKMFNHALAT